MKLTVTAENPLERIVLALGLAPIVLMDTHMSFVRARAIMVGTKLGIFDALVERPLTAADTASRCHTSPTGTEKLMNALVGTGYLRFAAGRYALAPIARKWLTSDAPTSMRDKVLFEFLEWRQAEGIEDLVRTGKPIDMHHTDSDEHWKLYQRAMRSLSKFAAAEIVQRTPVPARATAMLDIGGSHGYVSAAICRKHPELRATILDLPAAIKHAAPLLAQEGMGDRVVHRAGDALKDDLGTNQWDLVYVSQLVHHFDQATNRELCRRVARALKRRGVFVIVEFIRPPTPNAAGQVGALLDLYFAVTSQAGTWSVEEMTNWQRDAGLAPKKPVHLRRSPGAVEIIAVKGG
jgi:ubiquinone/menaquinone biosynthesis C-methylase UbiE